MTDNLFKPAVELLSEMREHLKYIHQFSPPFPDGEGPQVNRKTLQTLITALSACRGLAAETHVIVNRQALGNIIHGIEEGSDPLSAGNVKARQHFNTVRASLAPMIATAGKGE